MITMKSNETLLKGCSTRPEDKRSSINKDPMARATRSRSAAAARRAEEGETRNCRKSTCNVWRKRWTPIRRRPSMPPQRPSSINFDIFIE